MENELINLLTSQALGNGVLILIALTLYLIILFRKGIVKQLVEECGIATKKDLDDLRTEQKADSKELNAKMERMRKAILLLANQSIDDPERLERIKDLLTI
ncbi:MAG: hypothetical protein MdMp024_1139 [Bacteroidales bacterium]